MFQARKFQRLFQVRLKGVSRVFERKGMSQRLMSVSMLFQGSFQEISRKFQESFKKISRAFQNSSKGVSRQIEGCFMRIFCGYKGYLKEVQREFQGVSNLFQGCFKEV